VQLQSFSTSRIKRVRTFVGGDERIIGLDDAYEQKNGMNSFACQLSKINPFPSHIIVSDIYTRKDLEVVNMSDILGTTNDRH
jgi:hypothetical protein